MGRGSIITLHSAWDIKNKRGAGVTFMLIPLVFGTNGGKQQIGTNVGKLLREDEEVYAVVNRS